MICVPESNCTVERYLSHKQVVHPSERELNELDVVAFQVQIERVFFTCSCFHVIVFVLLLLLNCN